MKDADWIEDAFNNDSQLIQEELTISEPSVEEWDMWYDYIRKQEAEKPEDTHRGVLVIPF